MSIIIFLILPFSVLNLYWVGFRANYAELAYFFTSNETEYIIIYSSYSSILDSSIDSYIMRVDSKTNKLISDLKLLDTDILSYKKFPNNIIIYTFSTYSKIINNGETNIIKFGNLLFGHKFSSQASNNNSLLYIRIFIKILIINYKCP